MSAHTPGPWMWDDAVWEAYDPKERAPWLVAGDYQVLTGEIKCWSEADAHLIASAPDQFSALLAVDAASEYMEFDSDSRFGEAMALVRSAIAKATGVTKPLTESQQAQEAQTRG